MNKTIVQIRDILVEKFDRRSYDFKERGRREVKRKYLALVIWSIFAITAMSFSAKADVVDDIAKNLVGTWEGTVECTIPGFPSMKVTLNISDAGTMLQMAPLYFHEMIGKIIIENSQTGDKKEYVVDMFTTAMPREDKELVYCDIRLTNLGWWGSGKWEPLSGNEMYLFPSGAGGYGGKLQKKVD